MPHQARGSPSTNGETSNTGQGVEASEAKPTQRTMNSKTTDTKAQVVTAGSKFKLVWAASISPPTCKLVLLALAQFANRDGASIRPKVETVARMCGISPNSARIHIHALVKLGVLKLTRAALQWTTNVYAIDFNVLADLQPTGGLEYLSTPADWSPANIQTSSPLEPRDAQTSSPRASDLQPAGANPLYHRGNGDTGGTPRSGPVLADCPDGADPEQFAIWEHRCRWTPIERKVILTQARELDADGYSLNLMLEDLLDTVRHPKHEGYRRWPRREDRFLRGRKTKGKRKPSAREERVRVARVKNYEEGWPS
jgi:hypothetical protein